jgi:hypothetical protein
MLAFSKKAFPDESLGASPRDFRLKCINNYRDGLETRPHKLRSNPNGLNVDKFADAQF